MRYQPLLMAAALSAASMLLATDAAQAQRGGRGGVRPGAIVVRPGIVVVRPGPYYGGGYRYGPVYRPIVGIGGYGSPYIYTYPTFIVPRVAYYNSLPIGVLAPSVVDPGAPPIDAASIRVVLPDPNAKVYFDGMLTKQDGTDRLFNTPSLTSVGHYRIRAIWMENGKEMIQESVAEVRPGHTTVVDFTRPASDSVAPPPK